MKIRMRKSTRGSEDGVTVLLYEEGQLYDINSTTLIRAFTKEMKVAEEVSAEELEEVRLAEELKHLSETPEDTKESEPAPEPASDTADTVDTVTDTADEPDDGSTIVDSEDVADTDTVTDASDEDQEIDDGYDPENAETPEDKDAEIETPAKDQPAIPETEENDPGIETEDQPDIETPEDEKDLVSASGKPYRTHGIAEGAAKMRGVSETHTPVEVPNGYALRRKPEETAETED